jgi:threonine/homoserine/homoserine lactone efflux protein
LQEAWRGGLPRAHGQTARGDFATGAVFSLANPFALAFWTGIGSGFAASGGATSGRFALLFAGFAAGALLWCLAIPVLIGWGRRFIRPALFRWLNALCGVALSYFGLSLLWRTLHEVVAHAFASTPSAGRSGTLR